MNGFELDDDLRLREKKKIEAGVNRELMTVTV